MGVFERMRNGLIQFMYGRNGMDQLNRALLVAYLVSLGTGAAASALTRGHV